MNLEQNTHMKTIFLVRPFALSAASLIALSLLASGCGGGSSTTTSGGAGVTVSATPNPAPYNTPVTMRWGGTDLVGVQSSNFGASGGQATGSLTDNPGVTSTYSLTDIVDVPGQTQSTLSGAATVSIVPSKKSALIVGDASVSGPNQVLTSMQSITTGSVTITPTLPASTTADVVILHSSASLSTSDRSSLDQLLAAGKAVIFIGSAVSSLSGGNVTSLGGYLAGATSQRGGNYPSFRSTSGLVPMSVVDRGLFVGGNGPLALEGVSASAADRLVFTGSDTYAFAYKVPSGGRTGYTGQDGVGSDTPSVGYNLALRLIARWCMDGS
jgi:hypothetical protein